MRSRVLILIGSVLLLLVALLVVSSLLNHNGRVTAAVNIFASPVQAGCYIAAPNDCRIHIDPFTINITAGKKLALFQLLTIQAVTGTQRVIYDFRPDVSNPVPFSGDTYTPSLVAQDYAATCGKKYTLSLQGRDTGDVSLYNLGSTGQFTCPSVVP